MYLSQSTYVAYSVYKRNVTQKFNRTQKNQIVNGGSLMQEFSSTVTYKNNSSAFIQSNTED